MAVSDIRGGAAMVRPMPQRVEHPRPVEPRRVEPQRATPQRVEHHQQAQQAQRAQQAQQAQRVQDRPAPTVHEKGRNVDIRA